jgi:hypothetical protein
MKPLAYLALLIALGCDGRAEVFRPPMAGGRGSHHQGPAPGSHDRGRIPDGRTRGPGFGYSEGWHHRGGFRWSGVDLVLGLGPWYYGGWRGSPWWYDYGWPAYEPLPVRGYYPAEPVFAYPAAPTVVVAANSGLRDARSPEQLRAIFGEQAAGLIRGD